MNITYLKNEKNLSNVFIITKWPYSRLQRNKRPIKNVLLK